MAIAPIKLPRLQRSMPIVGQDRAPNDMFHRFLNMEFIPSIERALNQLSEQLNLIQQAQAAAVAAQAAADTAQIAAETAQIAAEEALAVAESGGSSYVPLNGSPPATASASIPYADTLAVMNGTFNGSTIDVDGEALYQIDLTADNGGGPVPVFSEQIALTSTGVQNVDLSWETFTVMLNLGGVVPVTGAVTFEAAITYLSGATIVTTGAFTTTLTFTNKAPP